MKRILVELEYSPALAEMLIGCVDIDLHKADRVITISRRKVRLIEAGDIVQIRGEL